MSFEDSLERFLNDLEDTVVLKFWKGIEENVDKPMKDFMNLQSSKSMIENTVRTTCGLVLKQLMVTMDGKVYRLQLQEKTSIRCDKDKGVFCENPYCNYGEGVCLNCGGTLDRSWFI